MMGYNRKWTPRDIAEELAELFNLDTDNQREGLYVEVEALEFSDEPLYRVTLFDPEKRGR